MDSTEARVIFAVARDNRITLVAAGLAFYLFNSLIPLVVFLVIGITMVGLLEDALLLLEPVLGSDASSMFSTLESVIGEGTGRGRAAIIAAGILSWSALTMFQSVNMAIGHVYEVDVQRTPLKTLREICLILVTVIGAMALMVAIHVGLTAVTNPGIATIASVPVLAVSLFGVFLPMFYLFSPPMVSLREVLPGVILTAVAWTVCAVGFRVFLGTSESVELYGIAGGLMLLLTWLYIGSLALLVGVVINAVLADRAAPE